MSIDAIEDYFELRDKGGIFGKINLRVFYAVFEEPRLIVVLGCIKKEAEGKTPKHIVFRYRNRLHYVKKLLQL